MTPCRPPHGAYQRQEIKGTYNMAIIYICGVLGMGLSTGGVGNIRSDFWKLSMYPELPMSFQLQISPCEAARDVASAGQNPPPLTQEARPLNLLPPVTTQ